MKNRKRIWPDYIENIKDIKKKKILKINFYRKIGKIGNGYGKTEPKEDKFKELKKFEVEGNELYNNRIINDPINNNKVVKKFRIPKSNEINSILYEAHNKCNHCGINFTSMHINIIYLLFIKLIFYFNNNLYILKFFKFNLYVSLTLKLQ